MDSLAQLNVLYYPQGTKFITQKITQKELESWPDNNFFDDDDYPVFCGEHGNKISEYVEIVHQELSWDEYCEMRKTAKLYYQDYYRKEDFEKWKWMVCQFKNPFVAVGFGAFIGETNDNTYSGGAEWDIVESGAVEEFLSSYASYGAYFWNEFKDDFYKHPDLRTKHNLQFSLQKTHFIPEEYLKPLFKSFIVAMGFSGGMVQCGEYEEYECETTIEGRIDTSKIKDILLSNKPTS